jgi:glycosyltransferase involved in cell wall biosynthesis
MRVLVVHNRYRSALPSGENEVVIDEVDALRQAGADVSTLTVDSDAIAGWSPLRRATVPLRVVWSWDGARRVATAAKKSRADVIHFHNTFPLISPAGLRSAAHSSARVVHTIHNYRPLCPSGSLFRSGRICEDCLGAPVPFAAVRHGCYRGSRLASIPLSLSSGVHNALGTWRNSVDVFIFPSAFTRDLYERAGWPAERMTVKHNMVPDPGAQRAGAGSGFLCIARLSAEKGVEFLLQTWRSAFPNGEQTLTVIGSGDLAADLRRRHAGDPGVRFAGKLSRDEVRAHLVEARAVIVPSIWYEVFPRTPVEALAAGVPVIASDVGGLTEAVHDGETGLLFELGSARQLVQALHRLAEDDALCRELGQRGRRLYERAFTREATTRQLLDIYQRAVASPRHAADSRQALTV